MKFYFRIPNSTVRPTVERFGTKMVDEVQVIGNCIDTEDTDRDPLTNQALEVHLQQIANVPGSGVSTKSDSDIDAEVRHAMEADVRKAAEVAQSKLVAAGIKP